MALEYEKLSAKTDGSPIQATDYLMVARSGATVKVLADGLATATQPADVIALIIALG